MSAPILRAGVGTAGWSLPRACADAFAGTGRHLERYARVLRIAEINSSFQRSHRIEIYARWAAQTPAGFRFSAKVPRAVTHEGRLLGAREPLERFLGEAAGLGDRLAVLLVQLPPSLAFDARPVRAFFGLLADRFGGAVVCEPRHPSWFEPAAEQLLVAARVGRVAADPARPPAAALPGGWLGAAGDGAGAVVYHRWHGTPRTYWSSYADDWLGQQAVALARWPASADLWCIFDNTASGAATANALGLQALLRTRGRSVAAATPGS